VKDGIGARFHQLSKLRRGDTFPPGRHVPTFKVYASPLETVRLAAPKHKGGPGVWSVMVARRSHPPEVGSSVSPSEIGQLLWAAQGMSGVGKHPGELPPRTIPSASGSYPLETYVIAENITDTFQGIYHYSVPEHQLEQVRIGPVFDGLKSALLNEETVDTAACAIVLTGIVERATALHGERGYRYLYFEAGHAIQNIQLAATALGISVQPIVTFYDDELSYVLNVPAAREVPLAVALVGR
jgi:SagB-type dehydrogenase family enzyme